LLDLLQYYKSVRQRLCAGRDYWVIQNVHPKKKKLLSTLNQIPICRVWRKMASFVHHGMRQIRRSCGAFAFLIRVRVCLGAVVHEVQAQAGLTSAVAAASAPALASGSLDSSSSSHPEAPPPAIGYYKAHGGCCG